MKLFILMIACVSIVASELSLTQEQLNALAVLDQNDLPSLLKPKVGDSSHWCCTNEQPVNSVDRTRVEAVTKLHATKIKTGYTSCGFAGLMSCSLYSTTYRQITEYIVQTYQVLDVASCKDDHVKCCKDYTLVAGNCMSNQQLAEHAELLLQLAGAGLLGVGK